tara:strand:+ start:385 stop:540 length:156 start_codon:yes stop_codon:yes gene_type:complete
LRKKRRALSSVLKRTQKLIRFPLMVSKDLKKKRFLNFLKKMNILDSTIAIA